ncbi:MAG TPA: hypothetical protein PKV71_06175 [Calditrichia bacterium]|nr:hypothetical protein [Calditrichota bacterium]HQV31441.1 hypothetical protein [Calditrichia bacterium]
MNPLNENQFGRVLGYLRERQDRNTALSPDLLDEGEQALLQICEKRLLLLKNQEEALNIIAPVLNLHYSPEDLSPEQQSDLLLTLFLIGIPEDQKDPFFNYANQFYPFFTFFTEVVRAYGQFREELIAGSD